MTFTAARSALEELAQTGILQPKRVDKRTTGFLASNAPTQEHMRRYVVLWILTATGLRLSVPWVLGRGLVEVDGCGVGSG